MLLICVHLNLVRFCVQNDPSNEAFSFKITGIITYGFFLLCFFGHDLDANTLDMFLNLLLAYT